MMMSDSRVSDGLQRLGRAQQSMARDGLDGLLLAGGSNLAYLTGYPTAERSMARPSFAVLPARGAPILIVHRSRLLGAQRLSWVAEVRTYERLSEAPVEVLAHAFGDVGLRGRRVGAELGLEQRLGIPVLEFERVRGGLAPLELCDAAELLWTLRAIKSHHEIDALRRACRVTADAYARVLPTLRPGMAERDVATALKVAMISAGGADPHVAITSGMGHYDDVSSPGTDRPLETGDLVWADSGCTVGGYWADFGRAAVLGAATTEQRMLQAEIDEITMAGVALARPGTAVATIAHAMQERLVHLDAPGISLISSIAGRVGHGIGLDAAEPPHVAASDSTVLAPGMVITIEPGVATAFGTFHVEEQLVVTSAEPEILSLSPRTLVEVDP